LSIIILHVRKLFFEPIITSISPLIRRIAPVLRLYCAYLRQMIAAMSYHTPKLSAIVGAYNIILSV